MTARASAQALIEVLVFEVAQKHVDVVTDMWLPWTI